MKRLDRRDTEQEGWAPSEHDKLYEIQQRQDITFVVVQGIDVMGDMMHDDR